MNRTKPRRRGVWASVVVVTALVGAGAATWPLWGWRRAKAEPLPVGRVERADLELTLVVGGEIEGGKSTIVECDLQNLPGPDGRASAGMTIIELIPDGTPVKKGDVLCRFDSSNYVELVRRQRIELEQARSEERQAGLELGAAQAALRSYRDGEAIQIVEGLQSKIALARSERPKAEERLRWAEQMFKIGYVSSDEVAQARRARDQQEVELRNQARALRTHEKYTVPKMVRQLEVQVEDAARRLEFGGERRESEESRLKKLEGLVEDCTVKAPHDGLVIHANIFYRNRPDSGETYLRTGAQILQGQPMFILPDLAHPIVQLVLHESIAAQVKAGMPARIRVPALKGRELTGKVQWVNPVPTEQWRAFQEFKGFDAKIAIDDPPEKLLPSYTAEVTIITGHRPDALVVPSAAVAVEDGQPFCYVAGLRGVERRAVELAPADRDRVEVVNGLLEGEQVVLDPTRFRTRPEEELDPLPSSPGIPAETARRGPELGVGQRPT
jgi:HlyD family secretion protein